MEMKPLQLRGIQQNSNSLRSMTRVYRYTRLTSRLCSFHGPRRISPTTLPNIYPRRYATSSTSSPSQVVRPLVPAPEEGSGPLLSRRPDRALPSLKNSRLWLKTMPIFILIITLSSLAIFNYQKSSSSTVNSVLYALRTNEHARGLLGDEVYFANKIPWIWGELNQLHGNINISFWVKGTKGSGLVKFVSVRKRRDGFFETLEWSLKMEDGTEIQLLEMEGVKDPLQQQQRHTY